MSDSNLQRHATVLTLSLTTSLTTTPAVKLGNYAGGIITIPSGSSITDLAWHVGEDLGGTYVKLYQKDNSAVVNPKTVAADRSYPIPDEVFAAKYLRIVADAAGTVYLHLKS